MRHLQFDALTSLVVILLVELEADEVSLLTDGCNGGGATAHTVVQYGVALVGVTSDKPLYQLNRLLSWVQLVLSSPFLLELLYRYRMPFSVIIRVYTLNTIPVSVFDSVCVIVIFFVRITAVCHLWVINC